MDWEVDELRIASLFKAVIRQAAKDVLSVYSTATDLEKTKAMIFLNGNKDLKTICEMADIEPKKIVEIMRSDGENDGKYRKIKELLKN